MKEEILIIGTSYGLGNFLFKELKKNKLNVTAWSSKKNLKNINYINFKKINFKKNFQKYNAIIYCSAISNFRLSEDIKLSKFINIDIITKIINNLRQNQKLIYLSTFGVKSIFQNKIPNYIKQKKKVENKIKKKLKSYFIIRPCKIINTIDINKIKKNKHFFYTDKYIYITSYKIILRFIFKILKAKKSGEVNIISKDKIRMDKLATLLLGNLKFNKGPEPIQTLYKFKEPNIKFPKIFNIGAKSAIDIIKDFKN